MKLDVLKARSGPYVGLSSESGYRSGAAIETEISHKQKFALPNDVEYRLLTTLREKLVKIGAKVVRHGRYVTFQLAEVAVPRGLFEIILRLVDDLRRRPAPA